ncbi:MAG: putative secreted protein [Polyangiaceae bacterium]|jgi:hypothetical protein|nr:putative secreted protein [Polyangiaceae bacterium]
MKTSRFDVPRGGLALRVLLASGLLSAAAHGAEVPPPPAQSEAPAESVALPSARAREPAAEPDAVKVRLDGEYEVRQSFLTQLPLRSVQGSAAALGQTTRLYHWLRLRGLALFTTRAELRAEADLPRGMIYGQEPEAIPDSGTDFDRVQPVRGQPRMLRLTLRQRAFELSVGHTTLQRGLGLVDADGDQPRYFGTPDRPATFERVEVRSGSSKSNLRVGASADALFDDGRLKLTNGDQLLRVGLGVDFAPSSRTRLSMLARYEGLRPRDGRGGAQTVLLDLSGRTRADLPGRAGELFVDYEAAYRVGFVDEPTAFALGDEQTLSALALSARAGFALERTEDFRRYAHVVGSVQWGIASGDTDPTDDELRRFVMNPNHGVGLILFSEVLRFKTSRAQALLAEAATPLGAARVSGLATGGGVAGATYLNPVLLLRPNADLTLKLGAVVASTTGSFVDPSQVAADGERRNYDGGSPLGRALGTELDGGAELALPLDAPMVLRLSVEGAVAFPGSAFDDAEGRSLGTQALSTVGLGLTF